MGHLFLFLLGPAPLQLSMAAIPKAYYDKYF